MEEVQVNYEKHLDEIQKLLWKVRTKHA